MLFWSKYSNKTVRKKNLLTDVCYGGAAFLGVLLYSIFTGAELSFWFVVCAATVMVLAFCLYHSITFAFSLSKYFAKLRHCTERVSGICIELEKHAQQTAYRPVWEYSYNGITYKAPDAFNRFTNAFLTKPGEAWELRLNPDFPDKPYFVNRRADRIMIGTLAFYMAAELAGLILIFLYI